MAGQMLYLTFLFALVVCMVHGAPLAAKSSYFSDDDIDIRANLDDTIDRLLPSIRQIILKNDMDPLKLPDFSEPIFPDLVGIFKGNVDLSKGWLQNLSLLKRSNHVTAIYKNKRLTMDLNLGFNVMDANYSYNLKHLLYKRDGDINVRLFDLDVNVVMTIDLNEYNLILDSISFSSVRKFDIKFEGNLLDRILNALTKLITSLFKNPILRIVENHAQLIFNKKIAEWNTMVPRSNREEIIKTWLDIVNVPKS